MTIDRKAATRAKGESGPDSSFDTGSAPTVRSWLLGRGARAVLWGALGAAGGYLIAAWTIALVTSRSHPESDPSLVVALVAIPAALVVGLVAAVFGYRR